MLALPVVVPAIEAYKAVGLSKQFPENYLWRQTGYSMTDNAVNTGIVTKIIGLAILGTVGHKIAGRLGINRYVKKMTFGYVQL